jgi:hypothetical protein
MAGWMPQARAETRAADPSGPPLIFAAFAVCS